MRRISLVVCSSLIFLLASTLVVFNACNKDVCKKMICKNNGVCRDGRCKCASGFEGVNCETKMYEKFIGTYDGVMRCNSLAQETITNIVQPGSKPNTINIFDIFATGYVTTATIDVESTDKIVLDNQTIGDYYYEGNGFIVGNYLTIYILKKSTIDPMEVYTCTYNAIKYTLP